MGCFPSSWLNSIRHIKNLVISYKAKWEAEGRHEWKWEWAHHPLSFLSLDFANWVYMLFISSVYCRRLFFSPLGHEILVISINKEISGSFQPRSEKAGWVPQGFPLISNRLSSHGTHSVLHSMLVTFSHWWLHFMLLLLQIDLTTYSDQCLCLHSSPTKKTFSQLPSGAQSPGTALSQASGCFSVPQCQQWDVPFCCVVGAGYFFWLAQYWLCEQDTGLITFLNGWYGSKDEGAGILNGTSCRFLSPYYPKPWLWETVLEVTSTYHHFSSIGMQLIPVSEQAFPTCLCHERKMCPRGPPDYPLSSWCRNPNCCGENPAFSNIDHQKQLKEGGRRECILH